MRLLEDPHPDKSDMAMIAIRNIFDTAFVFEKIITEENRIISIREGRTHEKS